MRWDELVRLPWAQSLKSLNCCLAPFYLWRWEKDWLCLVLRLPCCYCKKCDAMKFYCIADETTVRGFRLAGISGEVANSAAEPAPAVKMAATRRDCGVIILTEMIALSIPPLVDLIRFEQERPLIVVVPGPDGPVHERKSLRALVQEAVGVHLDLEKKN